MIDYTALAAASMSLIGTLVGTFGGILVANKLTNYRIEQLELKVAEHNKLVERIESGEVFEREGVKVWKCLNCGHLHVGAEAPEVCPVCNHPKAYFEEQVVNY